MFFRGMNMASEDNEINMSVEDYKYLWDLDVNSKVSAVINMLIVSLVSADSLLTKADCEAAKRELTKMKQALMECTTIRKKKRVMYEDLLEKSLYICDRDYKDLPG